MDKMGIAHARDTLVGSPLKKGISGGERKRLCVAMELLPRPKLLFLDEPTTGLDSVSALSLCKRLKFLTDSGDCTVICTIHQPQVFFFLAGFFFKKNHRLGFMLSSTICCCYTRGEWCIAENLKKFPTISLVLAFLAQSEKTLRITLWMPCHKPLALTLKPM